MEKNQQPSPPAVPDVEELSLEELTSVAGGGGVPNSTLGIRG